MKRVSQALLTSLALVVSPGQLSADPKLTHVKSNQYATSIGELIKNPDWFWRAYLLIYDEENKGTSTTSSGGNIKYTVLAQHSIDVNNLMREHFSVHLSGGRLSREEQSAASVFNKKEFNSVDFWEQRVKEQRSELEKLSPGLSDKLLDVLDDYENWELEGRNLMPVFQHEFNPGRKKRTENDLDEHLRKTIESDPRQSYFFEETKKEEAKRYLEQQARKKEVNLEDMSVKESIDFLEEFMEENFRYKFYLSFDPISFEEFCVKKGGNCVDFGYISTRMFNLMKEYNPELANTHWIPLFSWRYVHEGSEYLLKGHMLNAVFQTDDQLFTFVDLTKKSPGAAERTKTFVFK